MVKMDLGRKNTDGRLTRSRLESHRKQVEKLLKGEPDDEMKTFGKALVGLIDEYLVNERELFDELNGTAEKRKEES